MPACPPLVSPSPGGFHVNADAYRAYIETHNLHDQLMRLAVPTLVDQRVSIEAASRTSTGAEVDLVIEHPGESWAIEIKRPMANKVSRGFYSACDDLRPKRTEVVELTNRLAQFDAEAIRIDETLLTIERKRGRFRTVNLPGYYGFQGEEPADEDSS